MPAHWHILGTGAVGCLLASHLAGQHIPLTLLPRRPPAPGQRCGSVHLTLEGLGGGTCYTLPWEVGEQGDHITHLLVATKAYDVAGAVAAVAHRLRPDATVLLMANGMGFAEEVTRHLPDHPLTFGTTTEGAFRRADWQVLYAGRGATRIGRPGRERAPDWFADWRAALPDCTWEPAIEDALWRKLAINCAINPLTALHGCRNGQLGTDPALARRVRALCREIARVSEAAGRGQAVVDLETTVFGVIAATADNRSSMLQDAAAGRRTEIDYISGYLVATADALGVDAPLNRDLLARVAAIGTATATATGTGTGDDG